MVRDGLFASIFWGMGFPHPFSDGDSRRNQSMKGLTRVVVGSAVGGLLGAASFFAVDGLMPSQGNAQYLNEAGGNIYGDSRYNIDADPGYNINADPRYNIFADPKYSINGCR